MAASVAILTTAEAILSYSGVVHCGQMKKLNWVLSKNAAIGYAQTPEVCCVCHKNRSSSLLPKKLCRICRGRVCHTCRKPQELCFVDLHSRKVRKYKLSFCKRCVHAAHYQRTLEIAHDELVEENPWAPTRWTRSPSRPSSRRCTCTPFQLQSCKFQVQYCKM
ncbi:hypothetical protein PR003_g32360 [Phytophthora rubi]|uniref:FYVE-type domain-containing protein n=1 Tax=Phytophthora rubi TaxID=129364 RepID=A0A6A3GZ69_9STRA|nr:hypothetical protein PR001_g29694 [Phytophthora rubi]KAE9265746.1 hypothetical protein PR003_g32360 [Phytophthora rubi]